jgi:hypothetical protein
MISPSFLFGRQEKSPEEHISIDDDVPLGSEEESDIIENTIINLQK